MPVKPQIRFGVVGSGWRALCYLKTVSLLGKEKCLVTGIVSRNAEKRALLEREWGITAFPTAVSLVEKTNPDFLFVSVSGNAALEVILNLFPLNIPLLIETPPAQNLQDLVRINETTASYGARIQVAEQYWLQPMHEARLALLGTGEIGKVTYAHLSVNHGYHNISLMRKYLGIRFENAVIQASAFSAPLICGPKRSGDPESERLADFEHQIALLDFGGKRGLFDFEKDQHRSWVRSQRVLIRAEHGEIADSKISYLKDFLTPVHGELERSQTGGDGNFEGYYLKGVKFFDQWLYKNNTGPSRLSDEEISQARCLSLMNNYVKTGSDFYSLAEASQDAYLALMIREAESKDCKVETATQPWAGNSGY